MHPDGEVAVARAAAARGTVMGLSSLRQQAGRGGRRGQPADASSRCTGRATATQMVQRMERARAAGAVGLIVTLDWSFSMGRDWGSPEIPEKVDLKTMVRFAPEVAAPAALAGRSSRRPGGSPT